VSITSRGDVAVFGSIVTSGRGPLEGPGAPVSPEQVGYGGTYGGSGGALDCAQNYFSNTPTQV
jgi:hypothetical protein